MRTGVVNKVDLILGKLYAMHPRSTTSNPKHQPLDSSPTAFHAKHYALNKGSATKQWPPCGGSRSKLPPKPHFSQSTQAHLTVGAVVMPLSSVYVGGPCTGGVYAGSLGRR